MKKHNLTQAQFDILLDEGTEKNWTQKSVEESEKIRFIYRKFMK
jgi:peptide methionine sulfoxide reductase MsrB